MLYSLMANVAIQAVEYVNRSGEGGFLFTFSRTWPLILLAQWGLFETWRHAPHFLTAWLFFTVCNAAMRLTVSKYLLGETFAWWGPLGVVGMMGCAMIVSRSLHYGR
jgi:hypothetical protein